MDYHTPKEDGDLESAFSFHLKEKIEDVENILAQIPGEADGEDWH